MVYAIAFFGCLNNCASLRSYNSDFFFFHVIQNYMLAHTNKSHSVLHEKTATEVGEELIGLISFVILHSFFHEKCTLLNWRLRGELIISDRLLSFSNILHTLHASQISCRFFDSFCKIVDISSSMGIIWKNGNYWSRSKKVFQCIFSI